VGIFSNAAYANAKNKYKKLKILYPTNLSSCSSLAGGKVDGIWDCNALGALPSDYWAQ
jgi:hypothetical protein